MAEFQTQTIECVTGKGIFIQADLSIKTCKTCQQSQKRKIFYGNLPPKIFAYISNTTQKMCSQKFIFMQSYPYGNTCNIYQNFKNIKRLYGHLPPKIVA